MMKCHYTPFWQFFPNKVGGGEKCYLFLSLGKQHFRRLLQIAKTKSLTFLKGKVSDSQTPQTPPNNFWPSFCSVPKCK